MCMLGVGVGGKGRRVEREVGEGEGGRRGEGGGEAIKCFLQCSSIIIKDACLTIY